MFLIHVNTTRATVLALVEKKKEEKKKKTDCEDVAVVLRAELRLL